MNNRDTHIRWARPSRGITYEYHRHDINNPHSREYYKTDGSLCMGSSCGRGVIAQYTEDEYHYLVDGLLVSMLAGGRLRMIDAMCSVLLDGANPEAMFSGDDKYGGAKCCSIERAAASFREQRQEGK